jgi:hypothetical protein
MYVPMEIFKNYKVSIKLTDVHRFRITVKKHDVRLWIRTGTGVEISCRSDKSLG